MFIGILSFVQGIIQIAIYQGQSPRENHTSFLILVLMRADLPTYNIASRPDKVQGNDELEGQRGQILISWHFSHHVLKTGHAIGIEKQSCVILCMHMYVRYIQFYFTGFKVTHVNVFTIDITSDLIACQRALRIMCFSTVYCTCYNLYNLFIFGFQLTHRIHCMHNKRYCK